MYAPSSRIFFVRPGSGTIPSAAVALWHREGRIVREATVGDGPVDAVFKAIERITGFEPILREYQVRSVSVGEDAQGEALIEAHHDGKAIRGRGVSTDIIEASALAFLQVINRLALRQSQPRLNPQTETVRVG